MASVSGEQASSDQVVCITKTEVINGEERIHLDMEVLQSILMQKDVANVPVAVYSVVGPLRTGKSFLMTLLMRHIIRSRTPSSDLKSHEEDVLEEWFQWRGGSHLHTQGIYLLKEPFFVSIDPNTSQNVALFLMDTQGIFDTKLAKQEHEIIGALSFLMSSKQIFNLNKSIEATHFDHIYKFASLAEEIHKNSDKCSPFQKQSLMFLIRDWEIQDYGHGLEGGGEFLRSRLDGPEGRRAPEHELMKHHLKKIFGEIPCFLLPPPERTIRAMGSERTPIKIKDIGEQFLSKIQELFRHQLSSDQLVVKQMNGKKMTCSQLYEYMSLYESIVNTRNGLQGSAKHFIVILLDYICETMKTTMEVQKQFHKKLDYISTITAMKEMVSKYAENFTEDLQRTLSDTSFDESKDKMEFDSLYNGVMKDFDMNQKVDVPHFVSQFRKGLDLMLKEIFQCYENCRQAEVSFITHMDEFIKNLTGWNMTKAADQEKAKTAFDKAIQELEKSIHKDIWDQCHQYFTEEGNKLMFLKHEKVTAYTQRRDVILCVVGGLAIAVFGPLTALACAGTAAEAVGVAGTVFGALCYGYQKVAGLFTKRPEDFVANVSNSKESNEHEKLAKISLPLDLTFPLKFGVVDYPTRVVSF